MCFIDNWNPPEYLENFYSYIQILCRYATDFSWAVCSLSCSVSASCDSSTDELDRGCAVSFGAHFIGHNDNCRHCSKSIAKWCTIHHTCWTTNSAFNVRWVGNSLATTTINSNIIEPNASTCITIYLPRRATTSKFIEGLSFWCNFQGHKPRKWWINDTGNNLERWMWWLFVFISISSCKGF